MGTRRKSKRSRFGRIVSTIGFVVSILVLIGLLLVVWGLSNIYQAYAGVRANIGQVVNIEIPSGSQATRVYARDYDPQDDTGTLLAHLYLEHRRNVSYDQFPAELIVCLLSIEDKNFFAHAGVDVEGNIRALYNIVRRRGEIRGGGSTITQQLSRNVFLPYIRSQKTLNRKFHEIILAGEIEKQFSKQEILEAYLNHIFFGANAYGVKAAALKYFGKELDELTLAECALLAGLPQAPSKYNPYMHPEAAQARRDTVLRLLQSRLDTDYIATLIASDPAKFGNLYITDADVEAALAEPIQLSPRTDMGYKEASYFMEYLGEHVLYNRFGREHVQRQGLTVVTTIDPQYQRWAEEIVKEKIDKYRTSKNVSQGALILLEARTGEVLANVGGYEWGSPGQDGEPDKLNRAFLSDRQTGSSFKPFTYSTAYEQGFPVSLTIWDGPNAQESRRLGKAWPRNANGVYRGWVSVFYALQWSYNAASVDLLVNCTGIEPVIETARKMGITADLPPVSALTLGCADIKPIEMAEAFATFPNMGLHTGHTVVKRVYNQNNILIEANDTQGAIEKRSNRAFSENTAWMMVLNMKRVVDNGTGTGARIPGVQIGGKTGTTDDYTDAWFIGYSPELVCAVWVGNDDYRNEMYRMFGGNLPAEIFGAMMKKVYSRQTHMEGEGEDAVEVVDYEPRYTQLEFVKPEGATFSGFPGPVVGTPLVKDEEGNFIPENEEEGTAPEDQEDQSGQDGDNSEEEDDDDFYDQWTPPPDNQVFF